MKILKKNTIKLFGFISLFLTLKANAQSTNFSGTWHIDTIRTNFNGAPKFVLPHDLKVSQTNAGILIDRGNINGQGEEKHYMEQGSFDGKSSQTTTPSGNIETDSLGWGSDKSNLEIKIDYKKPDGSVLQDADEKWSLSENGKIIIINRQVRLPDGQGYNIIGYYNKD